MRFPKGPLRYLRLTRSAGHSKINIRGVLARATGARACQGLSLALSRAGRSDPVEGWSMRPRHFRILQAVAALATLSLCACGQGNQYVAPPPPKVTVAAP